MTKSVARQHTQPQGWEASSAAQQHTQAAATDLTLQKSRHRVTHPALGLFEWKDYLCNCHKLQGGKEAIADNRSLSRLSRVVTRWQNEIASRDDKPQKDKERWARFRAPKMSKDARIGPREAPHLGHHQTPRVCLVVVACTQLVARREQTLDDTRRAHKKRSKVSRQTFVHRHDYLRTSGASDRSESMFDCSREQLLHKRGLKSNLQNLSAIISHDQPQT